MLNRLTTLFPLWALLISLLAFAAREPIAGLQPAIVPLLALIMFVMGLTLKLADCRRLVARPLPIFVGVGLQYTLMPLLALTLANMLELSTQLTIGMVLVGSCAGGTASNVMTYLARGDLALSISMTLFSTLLGIVLTPLLAAFYLSETVAVDVWAMLINMLQIVLLPVLGGLLVGHLAAGLVARVEQWLPAVAIVCILIIIAVVVALNAGQLLDVGLLTLLAVILHNCLGLSGGFFLSRLFGLDMRQSQTIALEVGMQNSGLAATLALQFFSATAALPAALFSVWHNLSGSLLASWWARRRYSLDYMIRDAEFLRRADQREQ